MKRIVLLAIIILGFITAITNAQIITIPADFTTIQAGINAASDGDTVLVDEGYYFENINFKGKAITVASNFILDGDTSHISKTIIDGSQPSNQDSASVVTMISGEDENSKLIGLTITGGSGTIYTTTDRYGMSGAGILIAYSGATITNNIIEHNDMIQEIHDEEIDPIGGGIGIFEGTTVIIQDNTIRYNNIVSGWGGQGAGVCVFGHDILIDHNHIYGNRVDSRWGIGAGICYFSLTEGEKAVFSNNEIHENGLYLIQQYNDRMSGGGIWMETPNNTETVEIYNNLIYKNHTDQYGGAIASRSGDNYLIYNNTIVDNTAGLGGKNLSLEKNGALAADFTMFNNIIYISDGSSDNIWMVSQAKINLFNNLITGTQESDNFDADPYFISDSYELSDSSICIGRGVDSIEFKGTWYLSPERDFYGSVRPDTEADHLVDLGAIESGYSIYPQVGIGQIHYDNNIDCTVYPNPVDKLINIEYKKVGKYTVEITSVNGQLLYSENIIESRHQIDLSSFEKGVYFITIRSKDFVTTRKIIKL